MAEGDLCTPAQVAEYLGIPVPVSGTAPARVLDLLITAVSDLLTQEIGAVLERDCDESYKAHGQTAVVLRYRPVGAVYAVSLDGVALPRATNERGGGWWLDGRVLRLRCGTFGHGWLRVRYCAGYAADALPPSITDAAIDSVALAFKRRSELDIASKSLADQTVTYLNSAVRARAKAVLRAFADVVPA
jgi:hypothetical protein